MSTVTTEKVFNQYKNTLSGKLPYVRTHLDYLGAGRICFRLKDAFFAFKEEDGPLNVDIDQAEKIHLFLTCGGNAILKELECENGLYRAELPQFKKYVEFNNNRLTWLMYIVVEQSGKYEIYRIKESGENRCPTMRGKNLYYDRQNQYFTPYEEFKVLGKDIVSQLYITVSGNYSIMVIRKEDCYLPQFIVNCYKVKIRGNRLVIHVKTNHCDRKWRGFFLTESDIRNEEKRRYFIPIQSIKSEAEGEISIKAIADLREFSLRPLTWYLNAVFEEDDYQYRINIKVGIREFNKLYCNFFNTSVYEDDRQNVFFPYRTQTGSLAFKFRKKTDADSYRIRLKERLAIRLFPFVKKKMESQNIYLVYEKYSEMAEDNGYYFFKYCMEHCMEKELQCRMFYVIDKNAPDYKKVKKYGKRVISFLSFRYFLNMMAAKLLISSDNKLHAFAWDPMPSLIPEVIARKNHIFLQHGVTALKKVKKVFDNKGKYATDLFIVTSEQEKKIISRYYHYPEEKIAVTGFSRWDVLCDTSDDKKEILVMPTWRVGLDNVTEEEFCKSEYYLRFRELLNSPHLKNILEKYDAYVCFYIHPKMREYFGSFSSGLERVTLISFGECQLNELIMRCKMLVTDYSSVSWDVFYQKKPVLFYQFDMEQYNKKNGSFIDLEKDLFGDRAEDLNTLLDLLEETIEGGFIVKEKYAALYENSYAYVDDENSRRICEEIQKRTWNIKTEKRYV